MGGPAEFGWVRRSFGAGGPRSLDLDSWHAAQELGACDVWKRARSFGADGWHAAFELEARSLDGPACSFLA